jgi:outer membrane receptor protein involved in Fe transport
MTTRSGLLGFRAALMLGTACIVLPISEAAVAQTQSAPITVPAGRLDDALRRLALATGVDVLFTAETVGDARTTGVQGATSPDQALSALLSGSGLSYVRTSSGAYAIRAGDQDASSDATELEEVAVTGSRIRGLPNDGPVQARTVTAEEIRESGATQIIDVLRDLPQTSGGSGTFSTSTAGPLSGSTPVGAAGVSLRGLGTGATLTLINSRRASVASFARGQESFIDANSIPLAAIERVDVLPNGASALYGADAVAGVVNYILRDDFEGAEISVSYGDSTASTDEGKTNVSAVIGGQVGDHSLMLVGDWFKRNAFYDRDRSYTADSFRPSQQGFYPSFNDLFANTFDQTEEPGDGGCPASDFGSGNLGEYCEVDVNDFTATDEELESRGVLFSHKWRIDDRTEWFNEVLYQQSESRGTGSPANFSRTPIDPENPFWPTALQDDLVEDAGFTDFTDFYGFPIYAYGKLLEPRAVEVESESFRLVSGLNHRFDNGWSVEAALTYGGNDRIQRGLSGLVRTAAFYDANLGNLCTDGSRVERWDVDLNRPDADFVGDTCEDIGKTTLWYNPFGGQTNQDPRLADILNTTAERRGRSRLYAADISADGDLFTFNGRTVKAAFGAEIRREELRDTPSGDAVATPDNPEPILGFSSTSAFGQRDQWAAFAEFYVPLADNLELQLAGRYDDYDDFGGDFNPKVALRWAPIDSLVLRANWSTSFRAPSLAQSGAGVLLSSYRVDCEETPGACDGDAGATGQALLSEDVGNPNLEAENAESYGFGAVFTPTDTIDIGLDYWDIRHENLVGLDRDDFIRRALAGEFAVVGQGLLPTGTPGLEVSSTGFVTDAHFQIGNLGYQQARGLDFRYTQRIYDTPWGDFTALVDASYLLEFERQASLTALPIDEAGEYQYPQLTATAKLRWKNGPWRASVQANYTSAYKDDPDPRTLAAVGLPANAEVEVSAWTTFDFSLSRELGEDTTVQLNVRNLFDEDAPRVLGSGANVDHINHDTLGRFATVRITRRF